MPSALTYHSEILLHGDIVTAYALTPFGLLQGRHSRRHSRGWELSRDREEDSIPSLLPELQFSIHSITGSYACASGFRPPHLRRPDCTLSRLWWVDRPVTQSIETSHRTST